MLLRSIKQITTLQRGFSTVKNITYKEHGSKIRGRKFLASSYGENMPQYLNYSENPNLKVIQLEEKDDLRKVARSFRSEIDQNINLHSALLFKNLPIENEHDVNKLVEFTEYKQMVYISGNASRESMIDTVYEASNEPPELSIDLHNEMSYMQQYPRKIMFCCLTPPTTDGETPICFNKEFFKDLDKSFVEKTREKKIRYIRYYGNLEHTPYMTWQGIFNTHSRKDVEENLRSNNSRWEWLDDGSLQSWHIGEPFANHPVTGEEIWFNQLAAAHNTYYLEHPDYCDGHNEKQIPLHTTYGDGEEFGNDLITHHREVQWNHAIGFKWEQGDILVLDNILAQHGRLSYEGKRKLAVSLIAE